ncbi:MAG: hypothetical protein IGS54_01135 [Elainella sp. C42_A2020_010]|nr:hypothetical protein [Elainella sp. C42_A2020_010]
MPLFPTSPLDKAKLRSLLAHLTQPDAAKLPLSAVDRRKTQQWRSRLVCSMNEV